MKKKTFGIFKFLLMPCFTIMLTDCNGQTKQNIKRDALTDTKNSEMKEKFDVEAFNKHQQSNSYEVDLKDSHVSQFSYADGYVEEITSKGQLFKRTKDFYKNGNIKQQGLTFIKGEFMKGIWQFFDSSGNLSHEIDYDSRYKFTWDDVQRFLRENRVNIQDVNTNITRSWKQGEEWVWVITYKTTPDKNGNYIRTVTLNGNSGKIQKEEWTRLQRN